MAEGETFWVKQDLLLIFFMDIKNKKPYHSLKKHLGICLLSLWVKTSEFNQILVAVWEI